MKRRPSVKRPTFKPSPRNGAVAVVVELSADADPEAGESVPERNSISVFLEPAELDARPEIARGQSELSGQQENVSVASSDNVLDAAVRKAPILYRVGPVFWPDPNALGFIRPPALKPQIRFP